MTSNYDHDSIVRHAASMQGEIVKLRAEVETLKKSFGTIKEYQIAPLANCSMDDVEHRWHKVEDAYRASVDVCAANDAASKANSELLVKLAAVIEGAGLKTHTRRLKARSSYKTEQVTADWLANLRSAVPTATHTSAWLTEKYRGFSEHRAKREKERESARLARERELEESERKRLQTITLALAGRDLGIDTSTMTSDGLIDAIRKKDKYLDLALAMRETRGDWSEGFYRVRDALGRFEVVTPKDREIYSAVSAACHGEETDGRIFRDLYEWNYDALFGEADQTLLQIYSKITVDE